MQLRYASRWFVSFLQRLLEGQPAVTGLLCADDFTDNPPTYFRLALYQYRFTNREQAAKTGDWWQRRLEWMSPVYRVSRTPSGRLEVHPER